MEHFQVSGLILIFKLSCQWVGQIIPNFQVRKPGSQECRILQQIIRPVSGRAGIWTQFHDSWDLSATSEDSTEGVPLGKVTASAATKTNRISSSFFLNYFYLESLQKIESHLLK